MRPTHPPRPQNPRVPHRPRPTVMSWTPAGWESWPEGKEANEILKTAPIFLRGNSTLAAAALQFHRRDAPMDTGSSRSARSSDRPVLPGDRGLVRLDLQGLHLRRAVSPVGARGWPRWPWSP